MGMDVYGRNPVNENGRYFRRNVWGWRCIPLYISHMHEEFMERVIPPKGERIVEESTALLWGYNSGYGLDSEQARALADLLDADVGSGAATKWIHEYHVTLLDLPREMCRCCNGTGIRTDDLGVRYGWPTKVVDSPDGNPRMGHVGSCNGCMGWGSNTNYQASYDLELEDLTEFAAFMRDSGGFEIW